MKNETEMFEFSRYVCYIFLKCAYYTANIRTRNVTQSYLLLTNIEKHENRSNK